MTAPRQGGGIGFMVQAAFLFAVMSLLVKLAGTRLPTMQIVFARGVITLGIAAAMLVFRRLSPLGGRIPLLLLRGTIGSCAMVCFYAAVVHLPLAEATVIHQTAPLFTALLAAVWLHERLAAGVVIGLLGAFAGVVMIAQPGWLFGVDGTATAPFPWQYAFIALLGAVLSAVAYVTVRRLGRTDHPLVVVFWFPLVTVPLTAPFALPVWIAPDAREWLLLLGIGVTTQLAQLQLTRALARETAGRATAVGYLQVAFAALFGAVAFQAWPGAWSWAGMTTIVASLLLASRWRATSGGG
jgi:drug/metabolite transporter (DMT)-like permease